LEQPNGQGQCRPGADSGNRFRSACGDHGDLELLKRRGVYHRASLKLMDVNVYQVYRLHQNHRIQVPARR